MYSSTILQVSLRERGPMSSTKHYTVLHRCYKCQTLALKRGVHRHAYVRHDSFQNKSYGPTINSKTTSTANPKESVFKFAHLSLYVNKVKSAISKVLVSVVLFSGKGV